MARFIDETNFPLVWISYPPSFSYDDMLELLAEIDALLDRGERFAYLADLRSGFVSTARQRDLLVSHYDQRRGDWGRLCLAGAAVQSPGAGTRAEQKGMAKAVEWRTDYPFPRKEFESPEEATEWLRECLAEPP